MEFEKNIVNYLESKQSAEWSLIGVLRYLAENMEYTSETRNKANKLCESLKQTLTRIDINEFLDQQDVKFSKKHYVTNVEKSVIIDKIVVVKETSKIFAVDHNNEVIKNSIVEVVREEGVSAQVDGGNISIEQTTEGTQDEVKVDENEKMICVKSILEDSMTASTVEKATAEFFLKNFSTTTIMDLRPKTEFSLALDSKLQMEILHEIFDPIDNGYVTDEIHDFLVIFFNEDQSAGGWAEAIDNMTINNDDSKMLGKIKKLIKETLPKFEGARPGASQKKSIDDDDKNAKSMKALYNNIVIAEADSRHQLFTNLKIYGLTAFKTEVSLIMMDFRSVHRLFEIDHFRIPKDWIDMSNFVWMYEAIIKWALCVNSTREEFIKHRKKRKATRYFKSINAKKLARLRT
ncbi:16326_t:CDS:2 [Funneliformis mosseae]|uniref:16326_t:CDS:1 n=1 Tax=Funneliformis mosseae TaxID=27381 RepID=A0A9N9E827_FUNMO|nr:16326_t:CDS:2 [Funneliformis mosseae]